MWKTAIFLRASTLFCPQAHCSLSKTFQQGDVDKKSHIGIHRLFVNCTQENVQNCLDNPIGYRSEKAVVMPIYILTKWKGEHILCWLDFM